MATNRIQHAKRISAVSEMADSSLLGGIIDKDQHREIKRKAREMELDNLFKAVAEFCKK